MSPKYIILIPGAWHTGACYDLVVPLLQGRGFETNVLTLPSVTGQLQESFAEDVRHIRFEVSKIVERGEDVAVVMHSYGGVPGCEALEGLSKTHRSANGLAGGVCALIFLTAWVIPVGESLVTVSLSKLDTEYQASVFKKQDGRLHVLHPIDLFYNDLSTPEAERWAAQLHSHDNNSFSGILTYPAYRDIPSAYLTCRNDAAILYGIQLKLIETAGCGIVETCDTGHSPFLSQPDMVANFIERSVIQ